MSTPNKSTELNELFSALAKAQSQMGNAIPDKTNSYLKNSYASLSALIKASRPALTSNGLSVIQIIQRDETGYESLNTLLCHSSGQWIQTSMRVKPTKEDIQTLGSTLSYLRRYSYSAIVGISTSEDTSAEYDDDGEVAMQRSTTYTRNPQTVAVWQLNQLTAALDGNPELKDTILKTLNIDSLSEFPSSKYNAYMDKIKEVTA